MHYTMPSTSVLTSKVEPKESTELNIDAEVNVKKQRHMYIDKSNNSILHHHKLEEDATHHTSATTNRKYLLDRIIIGVCVVLVLYELIVNMILISIMREIIMVVKLE